jgi:hypothetical protein
MTLAVEDAGFQSLSRTEVPVSQDAFTAYQNVQTAAAGARTAVVTLYSDAAAVFVQCVISINGSDAPADGPQPPVEPEPEPPAGDNLLVNGGFEAGLSNWSNCADADVATISSDSVSGDSALAMAATTCLFQQVSVQGGGNADLSCTASSGGNLYTSLAVGFSDANFDSLGQTETEVTGNAYALHTVSTAVPANAAYAAVTIYSEEPGQADDCQLVISQ